MPNFTLRGPSKLGASQAADGEEALTAAVVRSLASYDEAAAKRDGPRLAALVLPARRELWRLAEVHEPRRLAAALRARLDPSDQSGRGGVRELREALADWLDPPRRCRTCRRPIRVGTELVGCPGLPERYGRHGRLLMRRACRAAPGRGLKYGRAHGVRDCNGRMKDGLTLSLFSPVQADTGPGGCAAAAARLERHGGLAAGAYDLVVDRDLRILFAAVRPPHSSSGERPGRTCLASVVALLPIAGGVFPPGAFFLDGIEAPVALVASVPAVEAVERGRGHGEEFVGGGANWLGGAHEHHAASRPAVCQAVYTSFSKGLDCDAYASQSCSTDPPAKRSPPDGIHPAVLAALRRFDRAIDRALRANGRLVLGVQSRYFSPKGAVTRADLLQGGADGLRRALLDYDPRVAKISTYAINWIYQGCGSAFSGRDLVHVPDWARRLRNDVEDLGVDPGALHGAIDAAVEAWGVPEDGGAGTRPDGLAEGCRALAGVIGRGFARAAAGRARSGGGAAVGGLVHSGTGPANWRQGRLGDRGGFGLPAVLVAAATAKKGGQAERARERLAACVGVLLGLGCKGPALLTALRHGAAQVVAEAGTGERTDGEGDGAAGGGDAPGAGRRDRVPEHLREESDDAESRAAEEQEAGMRRAAAFAGIERVRAADPEAAEVVRRRHGLDGAGEPETFEAIAAAPLRCTGRRYCRESLRKMYVRAIKDARSSVPGDASWASATEVGGADDGSDDRRAAGQACSIDERAMAAIRTFAARRAAIGAQQTTTGHVSDGLRRRPTVPMGVDQPCGVHVPSVCVASSSPAVDQVSTAPPRRP